MSSQIPIVNLEPLQRGGNGDLFLGQRSDNGERVVVKYLRESQAPDARKSFAREVRILSQRLQGIVPLLGWKIDGKRPYYVMPYFVRGPLTRYAGRFTKDRLRIAARCLATTLVALHARGIAHGDIKPDNVLVSNDGNLQVADPLGNGFGCTVLFAQHQGGTPGYWAPEVKAGTAISKQGDVFSYGATLAHLLTGQKPEDGQSFDQLSHRYPHAGKICEIIAACCQLQPSARPTMAEVVRMLNGESWNDIQVSRKQVQDLVKFVGVLGGLVLFLRALAR